MSTINQLTTLSTLTGSDNLAVYSSTNGDARKSSLSTLLSYIQSAFTSQTYITTITTPADGFTLTITSDGQTRWQILRPTANLATGTIVLPAVADCADGQELKFTTTLQIAALTVNANGATAVYGAPLVLAAEDFFTLRYNTLTLSWYRIA